MKKYLSSISIVLAVTFILAIASTGYSQEGESVNTSPTIAIIPFFKGKFDINSDEPQDQLLTCRIDQLCFITEDIRLDADKKLTNFTYSTLTERLGSQLLPRDFVSSTTGKIQPPYPPKATPKSIALKTGKSAGADLVIIGSVWRYKNRVSAKGSSDQPTSVAFVVYLLDVSSGNITWKRTFVKSQTTLTQDITNLKLVFKGGVKWLSADELAKFGVDEAFKEFPYPKN